VNRARFQMVCTALWGPQYRSEAARRLGVHLRTLMRYDAGERAIPAVYEDILFNLLRKRQACIAKIVRDFINEKGEKT
jgi:hypothetical protein